LNVSEAQSQSQAHHGPPLAAYFGVFTVLLVLTGVTVAAAYQDLGPWSVFVAVGIAGIKATLVILYFMHVRYSSRLIALYAASGFLFFSILLGITMGEVAGRDAQPASDPLRPATAAQPTSHGQEPP